MGIEGGIGDGGEGMIGDGGGGVGVFCFLGGGGCMGMGELGILSNLSFSGMGA